MRLLIITQKVDQQDPILGFFHRWIEEFADKCERVEVITQREGAHNFPSHVRVHSLGKESGLSRFRQILRFWSLILGQRSTYDTVFVHMTPIWVVLGYPAWWWMRKPVHLWYEARGGGWPLRVALRCVRTVFSASEHGLPMQSSRRMVTGHGIDTRRFTPDPSKRQRGLCLSVGRITPIKHYDSILNAVAALQDDARLHIAGGTVTARDEEERMRLLAHARQLGLEERFTMEWIAPKDMPAFLQSGDLFLHACGGGLDKALLEAMACGCLVLSSSEAARAMLPAICRATEDSMTSHMMQLLQLNAEERSTFANTLRAIVEREHSLYRLIDRLVSVMH